MACVQGSCRSGENERAGLKLVHDMLQTTCLQRKQNLNTISPFLVPSRSGDCKEIPCPGSGAGTLSPPTFLLPLPQTITCQLLDWLVPADQTPFLTCGSYGRVLTGSTQTCDREPGLRKAWSRRMEFKSDWFSSLSSTLSLQQICLGTSHTL